VVIIFLAIIAGFLKFHVGLAYYFFPGTEAPLGSIITLFITVTGGILVFMTFKTALKRTSIAEVTAQATLDQNQLNRFNEAIRQLGHDQPSVRMGSIYTLHGMAKESKDLKAKEQVCNILCSYVRDKSQSFRIIEKAEKILIFFSL